MSEPCYGPRFDDALLLAAQAFRETRRKSTGIPYIAHLLQVTATVAEHGGDEDQLIAALLHDYLEDVEGSSVEQLGVRFGEHVAWLVQELSDTVTRPKPPWRGRKERYLVHLRTAPPEVKLISAADKLHNIQSCVRDYETCGEAMWLRFRGRKEGTLWYYQQCREALRQRWDHPIVDEVSSQLDLLLEAVRLRESKA